MTLLPLIIEKATHYLNVLDDFANTGEEFPLDQSTTNVTFDVIGAVTMGEDMNAQEFASSGQDQLINMSKEMIKSMNSIEHLASVTASVEAAYADDKLQAPWWLTPVVI